jgi:hypothetical protein
MKWSDDSTYKGEWIKDERHYGTMYMVTGAEYTGYWKSDKFHGKGTLKNDDDLIFEGEFINGFRQKYGKLIYPDSKNIYTGELEDYNRNGYGKLEENGNVYEGFFEDNKKNGKGKMYYKNGDYYSGVWMDDRREGLGIMFFDSAKEVYEGEWMGDARSGDGKLTLSNGQVIECQWRNNKAQGDGKLLES